jgi:hypothetical protein
MPWHLGPGRILYQPLGKHDPVTTLNRVNQDAWIGRAVRRRWPVALQQPTEDRHFGSLGTVDAPLCVMDSGRNSP